jgi:hypothetical protein
LIHNYPQYITITPLRQVAKGTFTPINPIDPFGYKLAARDIAAEGLQERCNPEPVKWRLENGLRKVPKIQFLSLARRFGRCSPGENREKNFFNRGVWKTAG